MVSSMVPPPLSLFKCRETSALLLGVLIGGTGCNVGPGDEDGGTDSNGVSVRCINGNAPMADDSGGGDGDDGEPNFWWVSDNSIGAECPNVEGPCFLRIYDHVDICINDGVPEGLEVDVFNDWNAGNYPPSAEAVMRTKCSEECSKRGWDQPHPALPARVCEDENWTAVVTQIGWTPAKMYNCTLPLQMNSGDIDGSSIPWNLVGGSSSPLPLDCDLDGDCIDYFYPSIAAHIIAPGTADIIAPHTRGAHLFAAEGSGSQLELEVDMSGAGPGVDDTEPLYGMAEYTWTECGQSVCPFYLANLSAYNTTDTWDIRIEVGEDRIDKEISNVQIDLIQSTLGVQNMALSKIAFAPGALRLRVELTIDCQNCDTAGNGTHVAIIENDDYVFAEYDDGTLTLEHTFDIQSSGSATLTVEVVPGEFPPTAVHDLGTTEACDDPDGLVLDALRSFSTDPDSDVDFEIWWVDGVPHGHGVVVPVGQHTVALEVHDSRGAVHVSANHHVNVVASAPCS